MKTFINKISECVDEMISLEKEKQGKGARRTSEDIFSELAYLKKYKKMCDLYDGLSDPDALGLIPEITGIFEKKKQEIQRMTWTSVEQKENMLIELSKLRKQLGFDERERKIRSKK